MSLINLMKANPISTLKTVCICLAFMSVGFQAGILGPALLDLKILTASDNLASVTWIVTGRGIGFAVGSAIAGSLEPFVNLQLLMAIALICSGIMYLIIPLTKLLALSIACGSLAGIAQGVVDTASNVLMLKIWASDCPPFLQAVFSSYGIGSLVGPLIVRPFLVIKEDNYEVDAENGTTEYSNQYNSSSSTTDLSVDNFTINDNTSYSRCATLIDGHCPMDVNLVGPFLFTVCFPAAIACTFIYLYILHPDSLKRDTLPIKPIKARGLVRSISVQRQVSRQRTKSVLSHHSLAKIEEGVELVDDKWTLAKVVVISLVSIFALFFTGVEQGIGTYIPAFGVGSDLHMDKHTAAAISSLFWAFLTAFQLVSIPVTALIGVEWTLVINLVNCVISATIFMIWSSNQTIFFISSAYLGISYASSWGALFAFLEARFNVTGFIVAILTVTSCIGQSLAVAVIGLLIDAHPSSFPLSILVSNVMMMIMAIAIYFMCKKFFPPKHSS